MYTPPIKNPNAVHSVRVFSLSILYLLCISFNKKQHIHKYDWIETLNVINTLFSSLFLHVTFYTQYERKNCISCYKDEHMCPNLCHICKSTWKIRFIICVEQSLFNMIRLYSCWWWKGKWWTLYYERCCHTILNWWKKSIELEI